MQNLSKKIKSLSQDFARNSDSLREERFQIARSYTISREDDFQTAQNSDSFARRCFQIARSSDSLARNHTGLARRKTILAAIRAQRNLLTLHTENLRAKIPKRRAKINSLARK